MMMISHQLNYVWMGNGKLLKLTTTFPLMQINKLLLSVSQLMDQYGLWFWRRRGRKFTDLTNLFAEDIIDRHFEP